VLLLAGGAHQFAERLLDLEFIGGFPKNQRKLRMGIWPCGEPVLAKIIFIHTSLPISRKIVLKFL